MREFCKLQSYNARDIIQHFNKKTRKNMLIKRHSRYSYSLDLINNQTNFQSTNQYPQQNPFILQNPQNPSKLPNGRSYLLNLLNAESNFLHSLQYPSSFQFILKQIIQILTFQHPNVHIYYILCVAIYIIIIILDMNKQDLQPLQSSFFIFVDTSKSTSTKIKRLCKLEKIETFNFKNNHQQVITEVLMAAQKQWEDILKIKRNTLQLILVTTTSLKTLKYFVKIISSLPQDMTPIYPKTICLFSQQQHIPDKFNPYIQNRTNHCQDYQKKIRQFICKLRSIKWEHLQQMKKALKYQDDDIAQIQLVRNQKKEEAVIQEVVTQIPQNSELQQLSTAQLNTSNKLISNPNTKKEEESSTNSLRKPIQIKQIKEQSSKNTQKQVSSASLQQMMIQSPIHNNEDRQFPYLNPTKQLENNNHPTQQKIEENKYTQQKIQKPYNLNYYGTFHNEWIQQQWKISRTNQPKRSINQTKISKIPQTHKITGTCLKINQQSAHLPQKVSQSTLDLSYEDYFFTYESAQLQLKYNSIQIEDNSNQNLEALNKYKYTLKKSQFNNIAVLWIDANMDRNFSVVQNLRHKFSNQIEIIAQKQYDFDLKQRIFNDRKTEYVIIGTNSNFHQVFKHSFYPYQNVLQQMIYCRNEDYAYENIRIHGLNPQPQVHTSPRDFQNALSKYLRQRYEQIEEQKF